MMDEMNSSTAKITGLIRTLDAYQLLKPSIKVKTDMKTLISACVKLVTVNGRPYSLLNDSGFQKIIHPMLSGIPNSVVLTSFSIKKYIYEESVLIRNNIADEIQFKLISLKIDAVTRLNRGFLGINLQFIENNCIQLRTIIGLVELTESHTGNYLKEKILNVLNKFNIKPCQLYTITSDNGANMLNAINLLEKETSLIDCDNSNDEIFINEILENTSCSEDSDIDEISTDIIDLESNFLNQDEITDLLNEDVGNIDEVFNKSEIILNSINLQEIGDSSIFTGVRCVAHSLQLAVLDSLKDVLVDPILNKVRALVRKIRNQTYVYLIKKEKLKVPILDCLTRWNSTHDMLDRLLYLKDFIKNMSENDKKLKKVVISNFEWQQVENISKALLPARICSKKLQTENLTMTNFYGSWISCKIQAKSLNSQFGDKIVQCMINREKHIMNNHVLLAAIFLDPRFSVTLSVEQSDIAIKHLKNIFLYLKQIELKKNEACSTIDIENQCNNSSRTKDTTVDPPDELEMYLKSKDNNANESQSDIGNLSDTQNIGTKIELLLKSFHIEEKRLSHKTDILQFWKLKSKTYPELFQLSNIVFSVPATQVSVERLFSGLKFVLSPYRCNISEKNLEDQLFVRTNRLFEKNNSKNVLNRCDVMSLEKNWRVEDDQAPSTSKRHKL